MVFMFIQTEDKKTGIEFTSVILPDGMRILKK